MHELGARRVCDHLSGCPRSPFSRRSNSSCTGARRRCGRCRPASRRHRRRSCSGSSRGSLLRIARVMAPPNGSCQSPYSRAWSGEWRSSAASAGDSECLIWRGRAAGGRTSCCRRGEVWCPGRPGPVSPPRRISGCCMRTVILVRGIRRGNGWAGLLMETGRRFVYTSADVKQRSLLGQREQVVMWISRHASLGGNTTRSECARSPASCRTRRVRWAGSRTRRVRSGC